MKKILFLLSFLVPFALLAQNRHVGPYSSDVGGINYIHQIPVTKQYYPAQGLIGSGTTVTNYPASALDSTSFAFTTTNYFGAGGTKYGGFMYASLGTDSVLVTAPYSILIGSSFDEGHLSRHSRIHPGGVPVFQWNYPDSTGQLSWALDSLTNMRWYNHGIGGQTSSQVRARWARDVLGQVINGLIDGRGNQTLLRTHPYAAFYDGVGNDWTIGGMTPQITINNLIYFAESCQENGIKFICVISVTGAGPSVVGDAYVQTVNKFLEGGGLNKYGAVVVNLRDYWSDPAWGRNIGLSQDGIHGNPNLVNSTDFTHFTELGYDSVASWLVRTARIPKVTSVVIASALAPVNPVANFNYPSALTIDGQAYTTAKAIDTILLTRPLGRDPRFVYESGDSVWIKATAVSPIGTVTGTKWGIGYMAWVLDNTGPGYDTTSAYTRNMAGGSMGTNLNISSLVIQPENGASTNPYLYIYNAGLTSDIFTVNPASTPWAGVNMQGTARVAQEALSVVGDINTHGHSIIANGGGSIANITFGSLNGNSIEVDAHNAMLFESGSSTTLTGPNMFEFDKWGTLIPSTSQSSALIGVLKSVTGFGAINGTSDTICGFCYTPTYNNTGSGGGTSGFGFAFFRPTTVAQGSAFTYGLWIDTYNNYLNPTGGNTIIGATQTSDNHRKLQAYGSVWHNDTTYLNKVLTGTYAMPQLVWDPTNKTVDTTQRPENNPQTVVNGATSGTITCSQPFQGSSYKKVIIYAAALNGAAVYTFPTAFTFVPVLMTATGGAFVGSTTISSTQITVTGSTQTGFIILEGY